jgi:predicted GNAT family acetyltransferase
MGPTDRTEDEILVHHDPDRDRFEARRDGQVLGVLQYEDQETGAGVVRDMRSTVVDPAAGGRGVGSSLVVHALDDTRERGLTVKATCWFVRGWIQRHPDYQDLLQDPGNAPGAGAGDGA